VSPSGTGYHVLVTGKLPDGRNRRGSVELYDTARFFTVTGDHVKRTPTRVARRQDALTAIHREYVRTPTLNQHPIPNSMVALTRSHRRPVQLTLTSTPTTRISSRKRGTRRTARSSSGSGTEIRSATTVSPRPTWRCAVCWRSGPAAIRRKWSTCSANQDCFGRSGTRFTTLMGRRTGEDHRASDCDHFGVLRSGRRRRYRRRHPSGSSPDVGAADSERSRAYLAEKNRLLSERVDELEATLAEKTEQTDALEAEIERLTNELATRGREEESQGEHVSTASENGSESGPSSMLNRLFGGGSE